MPSYFSRFVLLPLYDTQSEALWVGNFHRERIHPAIDLL